MIRDIPELISAVVQHKVVTVSAGDGKLPVNVPYVDTYDEKDAPDCRTVIFCVPVEAYSPELLAALLGKFGTSLWELSGVVPFSRAGNFSAEAYHVILKAR